MTPTLCIDAGHGGHDSGAVGPSGLLEKDVALNVAMLLELQLRGECGIIFTRQTDAFVSLSERAAIANRASADAFLSIHCNSGPPNQGEGFEVWTSPGQTASDWFATDLFNPYAEQFPTKAKRMDLSDKDPDKESKFTVLVKTNMAAALFELEFIHTLPGEEWLANEGNQYRMAEALAWGVRRYLKLGTKAVTPPEPVAQGVTPTLPATLLAVEGLAALGRWSGKVETATVEFRSELEAIFRKS